MVAEVGGMSGLLLGWSLMDVCRLINLLVDITFAKLHIYFK
jgi:uncharacterized membrane protein (Fun14 family)